MHVPLLATFFASLQKRKIEGLTLSEAEAKAVQPVAQQRQAAFGGSCPLTSGSNQNFQVLGFTNTQRALFMKVSQHLVPQSGSRSMLAATQSFDGRNCHQPHCCSIASLTR